jgi:hypothetical protein
VRRPAVTDYSVTFKTPHWKSQGLCSACPREGLLIVGDEIIEAPVKLPVNPDYVDPSPRRRCSTRGISSSPRNRTPSRGAFLRVQLLARPRCLEARREAGHRGAVAGVSHHEAQGLGLYAHRLFLCQLCSLRRLLPLRPPRRAAARRAAVVFLSPHFLGKPAQTTNLGRIPGSPPPLSPGARDNRKNLHGSTKVQDVTATTLQGSCSWACGPPVTYEKLMMGLPPTLNLELSGPDAYRL